MNDIQQIKEVFTFLDKITDLKLSSTKQLMSFISKFMEKHRKAEANLAYHINLIDELHAGENAHSRILAKLLQQKTPYGKFEILESFIKYIRENSKEKSVSFQKVQIENPNITQEILRIDLWIRDNNYAIIVENKVHWARDESEQLARYIDKTKAEGYDEKQIYVVYLSPTYDKTPDEQTWGNYKDLFAERYINLSFRDDILPWLINDILPNVKLKDKYLSSALEQYIDHLKGMFDLRNINKKMNMDLQEFIKQELGLTGTSQENLAKLEAKQREINNINNQIDLLKKNFEQEIFKEWKASLKKEYVDYEQIDNTNEVGGVYIPINDTKMRVVVSYNSKLYCQVDMDHLDKEKRNMPPEVIESIKHLLPEKSDGPQFWKYLPRDAYDETFDLMRSVLTILTKMFPV